MTGRIAHLWAHHRIILLAFVIAVMSLGFFGIKTAAATIYWLDPAHQDQPLAGWMTPRYVARSYKLPPDVLATALFLTKDQAPRRISLDVIATENNLTLDELQSRIDTAAANWRTVQEAKQ